MKTFKPQLAEDLNEVKEPITFPKRVSVKLDGIRLATPDGVPHAVVTRSLKMPKNLEVEAALAPFRGLDCEIICGDPTAPNAYSRTQSFVNSLAGRDTFKFYVFDDLTDLSLTFEERLKKLHMRDLPEDKFVYVEQHVVNDSMEMTEMYERNLANGYEGSIVRNPGSMYKFGRCTAKSQDMLKMKPLKDSEFVIEEVFEAMKNNNEAKINELGRTARSSHQENLEPTGRAGGFIGRDVHTGVRFRCAIGSFTHAEAAWIWEHRAECVGRIIVYRYMDYGIKESTGIPRMPRAKGWREKWDMS